jgi:hypothetical protein
MRKPLGSPEEVGRGLRGFMDGSIYIPRITQDLRLPAFKYAGYSQAYLASARNVAFLAPSFGPPQNAQFCCDAHQCSHATVW